MGALAGHSPPTGDTVPPPPALAEADADADELADEVADDACSGADPPSPPPPVELSQAAASPSASRPFGSLGSSSSASWACNWLAKSEQSKSPPD
jgi:hypothetical protein